MNICAPRGSFTLMAAKAKKSIVPLNHRRLNHIAHGVIQPSFLSLRQEAGDIEAGAGLVGVQVVMANNAGLGEETVETLDQRRERLALGRCTRVLGRATVTLDTSDVGYTDAVGVVATAVGTGLIERTCGVDTAVERDEIVITASVPAQLTVPTVDVLERDITALRRCRAMDDEMSDGGYVVHGGLMMMDDGANGDFKTGVLHRFTP